MAGGLLILLGLSERNGRPLAGEHCATGIHGGEIYLRGEVRRWCISPHARLAVARPEEIEGIRPHVAEFCAQFGGEVEKVLAAPFLRVAPFSHRPFGAKYAV
jgi:glutamate synthase domain-containing protein 3